MDTSAGAVRKAVTEEDKLRHRKEGRCYECSKIGHLAHACPSKPAKAKVVKEGGEAPPQYEELTKGDTLADLALKLSEEERDAFIRKVMGEEKQDFAEA